MISAFGRKSSLVFFFFPTVHIRYSIFEHTSGVLFPGSLSCVTRSIDGSVDRF